jgi:hypothetical protein
MHHLLAPTAPSETVNLTEGHQDQLVLERGHLYGDSEMGLHLHANWKWAEVVETRETDQSAPDQTILTHLHSVKVHSEGVDSTTEVEAEVEEILTFAPVVMTATPSDPETDHHLQGGEASPVPTEMIGGRSGVRMIAGSSVMTVSANPIVSEETLLPLVDSTHVHLHLINKDHQSSLLLNVHHPSNRLEMISGCEDLQPLPYLESKNPSDANRSFNLNHPQCHFHQTTFWLAVLNLQPLVMALAPLHHHHLHHKSLLLALYPSSLNRIVDRPRMCGKHHPSLELHLYLQSRPSHHLLWQRPSLLLPRHR